ncbi:MAG TPA: glucoamylase family protein [Candidatus Acidoferrales bacterium]
MGCSTASSKVTRREMLAVIGKTAVACPVLALGLSRLSCGGGTKPGVNPPGDGYPGTDEQLLDEIERAGFLFFWEQADPSTGQIKDRSRADGNDTRDISSIAATGFGLTGLCIADSRGYAPTTQLRDRVRTTLDFLANQMPHVNGFFYHMVDMNTGARAWQSELSSIDSAILLCGVLTCRQHFNTTTEIVNLATQIYQRFDFNWMLNGGPTLSMGWTPESEFLPYRWDTYSELMMLYLQAIGSTTFPIPASSWDAWARPTLSYQGLTYISPNAPLFVHQYSHAWIDFRNRRDAYADYFQNSATATQAHKLFCLSLRSQFAHYSDDLWGITASDSVNGYVVWGGPPAIGPIDGTVVPCATAGSLPFVFAETMRVLRNIRLNYPNAWRRYGFVDAFNPARNWYNPDVIGINQGITMLMAENARTRFVWNTFMKNAEIQDAMTKVGFRPA